MDSPLILLVIWVLINIFIKSANDKKKIEEARRKRAQKLGKQTPLNNQTLNKNIETAAKNKKSIIDVFKEEIEKEIQAQKQTQKKVEKPVIQSETKELTITEITEVEDVIYEDTQIDTPVIKEKSKELDKNDYNPTQAVDLKKDILKGIIYAEILSEPKSIKNMKRSM
ncbi:hypothetical protein [Tissierella sp. Yu-01]|uniref:hypothetical protein n=1 Tax=Tissierella sp. Yu-01 TaxID=3035694 RepID=UPI00240CF6E4|nr:hypothetical protein [Tissierella sp. Yu-01]WFA09548.1 hypothetical protein P3962_03060 [Tissierella sp. Yu-01]